MSNVLVSFIRTWVPILVGSVITWLATRYNFVLPENLTVELTVLATGAVIGAYYGILRLLEQKWPWFGKLLGKQAEPEYVEPPAKEISEV